MVVRNNLSALNTLNTLNRNHTALAKSLQEVSSGMRINSAKDDTSGYAISERMRVQIRSLNQDNQNTQNGHSLMKVAEGAVQSTVDILKTLKEKVINAANDTNTDADRAQIQKELDQSIDQINDNANVTYNGKYLVDGSKNSKGEANYTTFTNYSLHETMSSGTALTDLLDRAGQSLNIQSTDTVTVSYVQNGKTHTGSYVVGTTCLQDILKKAEDLDSGTTFASQHHAGVAAALGIKDTEELIKKGEDAAWYAAQTGKVSTYAGSLESSYSLYTHEADKTYNILVNAAGSAIPTPSSYVTANILEPAQNATSTWESSAVSANGYRDPSALNSPANTGSVGTILGYATRPSGLTDDEWKWASYFKAAFEAYKKAYDNLSTFLSDNDLSNVHAIEEPHSASGSSVETITKPDSLDDCSVVSYDLSSYAKYAETAGKISTTADNYNKNFNAPTIISSDNIGLSHSGQLVKTANNEKALTITAFNSGIDGQVSGFTVSISDTQGNIKKSANAVLDAWEESIRAENTSEDNALVLHTGTRANQAIKIGLSDMRAQALGLQGDDGSTLNVSTQEKANAAINVLDNALQKAINQQTTIGSIESRLDYTSTNLTTAIENVTASESTIRDTDMAQAMTQYTKNNILRQSSQAMLAQANQSNNQVLSLLR